MKKIATKPRSIFIKSLAILGGFVAIVLMVAWVQALIRLDPFAAFRNPNSGPFGGMIALRMEDVAIKYYKGNVKIGACLVQRLDVHRDRQIVDFYNVKNAFYVGPNGRFDYETERAQWNAGSERLQVMRGAKVWNADMKLNTTAFEYSHKSQKLFIPGEVKGTLYEGKVNAKKFTYSLQDGTYNSGPVHWEGMAAFAAEDTGEAPAKKSAWQFDSNGISTQKNGINTMPDCQATDGDIIVKAPLMVHDRKTDIVTATGKVLYYSAKTNLICDKAVIYRKEKRAILSGHVQMVLKPKDQQKLEVVEFAPFKPEVPDEISKERPPAPPEQTKVDKTADEDLRSTKTIRKYPVVIQADNIEYWYGKGNRHAVITGKPQARQDLTVDHWRYVWTHKAYYDGEKEILKMVSTEGTKDTIIKTSAGDVLNAKWFEISTLEDNDETSSDGMTGIVHADEDEIPKSGSSGDKKTGDKKADDKKSDDKKSDDKSKPPIKGNIGG
jgi:hypothetical protein